jgi:hypothetical protein
MLLNVLRLACLVGLAAAGIAADAVSELRLVSDLHLSRWASPRICANLAAAWQVRRGVVADSAAECDYYSEALARRQRDLAFVAAEDARLIAKLLPTGACASLPGGLVLVAYGRDDQGRVVFDVACLSAPDYQVVAPRTATLHHDAGTLSLTLADPRSHVELLADEIDVLSAAILPDRGEAVGLTRADRVVVAAGPRLRTARYRSSEELPEHVSGLRFDGVFTVVGWDAEQLAASLGAGTRAGLTRSATARTSQRVTVPCVLRSALAQDWFAGDHDSDVSRLLTLPGVQLAVVKGQVQGETLLFPLRIETTQHVHTIRALFDPATPLSLPESCRVALSAPGPKGVVPILTSVRVTLGPVSADVPPVYTPDETGRFGSAFLGGAGYQLDAARSELLVAIAPPPVPMSVSGRQKGAKLPPSVSGRQKGDKP